MLCFKNKKNAEAIRQLEQEIALLEAQNRADEARIETLKQQLYHQKEKSVYVNEALNDALALSKEITDSAYYRAKSLLNIQEEKLSRTTNDFDRKVQYLEDIERQMIAKEEYLRRELKYFMKQIADNLDGLDTQNFERLCQELENQHYQVKQELEASKNFIQLAEQSAQEDKDDPTPVYYMTRD
ncbi:MAG: hypothetical protein Q4B80_02955 [Aerococcaceae bacterium]|nr:hypothetical protein [Aerococcaceae bacterium]